MPAYNDDKLLNMSITANELNLKHQLNPDNNGVNIIDECMSYSDMYGATRGMIKSVHNAGKIRVALVKLVNSHDRSIKREIIPTSAFVLNSEGKYVSIDNGDLRISTNIPLWNSNKTEMYYVQDIYVSQLSYQYCVNIRTTLPNYIMQSGIILKSD